MNIVLTAGILGGGRGGEAYLTLCSMWCDWTQTSLFMIFTENKKQTTILAI